MEFKDLIKKRRLDLGLTMEELGKKIGVSKATIQRYESGEIKNVRRDKIAKLANALDTTPAYLMGWEDNLENAPDILPDLMSDNELLDNLKMLMELSKEHRQTIFDNITYWHEKEGH